MPLPFEFSILICAVGLGFIQLLSATHFATKARGVDWNVGPRDAKLPPLEGLAGRLERVVHNFAETFPFFAAVTLMVVVAGKHSNLTVIGASVYLAARVFYVFAYAAGIRYVRTALWVLSVIGILLLLIALIR